MKFLRVRSGDVRVVPHSLLLFCCCFGCSCSDHHEGGSSQPVPEGLVDGVF